VVDIMPHPGTSPETVTLLHDFARSIDQIPIHVQKESPSYVFNAMLDAVLNSATQLAVEGVASVQDIDRAWMGIMKTPLGPFGIMDLVGLDLVYDITVLKTKGVSYMPQARKVLNFFKAYVDEGKLGMKSGEGFYVYPNPAFERPGFVEGE
jgi:3-hydroxybutyryl-CoA dehydrogenase